MVNACIGFIQESKALNAIDALSKTMSSEATVIRNGVKKVVSAVELVPGDLVLLSSGSKVPADIRLIHSRELQVDESMLTGESLPVEKKTDSLKSDTVLADRNNLAYSSTLVTYGTGRGMVVATGDETEIGRISELINSAEVLETPLTKKITQFSHTLVYVILGMAALTFIVGAMRGQSLVDMFMAAVALSVGAIPEGLPAAVTITLAIGVTRMSRRNAIIRKLPAVETLGSTTVICSDKTGTLTQNQMTVQEIVAGEKLYHVLGIGYSPDGQISDPSQPEGICDQPALKETLRAGFLCNDSTLVETEEGWRVEGDPTEGALIVAARKANKFLEDALEAMPRIDSIPFESDYQYMATLHRAEGKGSVAYIKGSAESILSRCSDALDASGNLVPFDVAKVHVHVERLASRGLRVLAFARLDMGNEQSSISHDDIEANLTFLGLQGMIDPPRSEATTSVHHCHAAGIQVKMITGDHIGTAKAVASQIGLDHLDVTGNRHDLVASEGKEIASLGNESFIDGADKISVFARVAPEQKLRIVEALQSRGHVVAMTGDGVNDAPALRRADIGIAMGITGTEVSREAADMVLTDDNFSSIESAVEEGRGVFDNLIKFIVWTLPTNLGEGLVIMAAIFAGVVLPILPVQILWINMTTAVLLGLMLAFEPKEPGIMDRAPRDPKVSILTKPIILRVLFVGLLLLLGSFTLFKWTLANGGSIEKARTVAVNVFVFGEMFYLFNCRSLTRSMFAIGVFSNLWLVGGVLAMGCLQILYVYTPAMNKIFQSTPLGIREWAGIFLCSLLIYTLVGFEKWIQFRLSKNLKSSCPPGS
jgi:cation-transporting ATPase F